MTLQDFIRSIHADAQAAFDRLDPCRILDGAQHQVTITTRVRQGSAGAQIVNERDHFWTAEVSVTLPLQVGMGLSESEEARRALVRWCEDLGIVADWPERLHLADVLDKHVFPQLRDMVSAEDA